MDIELYGESVIPLIMSRILGNCTHSFFELVEEMSVAWQELTEIVKSFENLFYSGFSV